MLRNVLAADVSASKTVRAAGCHQCQAHCVWANRAVEPANARDARLPLKRALRTAVQMPPSLQREPKRSGASTHSLIQTGALRVRARAAECPPLAAGD